MNSPNQSILIVDHEPVIANVVKTILEVDGYKVTVVESSEQALNRGAVLKPHLLIIDPIMPGISGVEVATRLAREAKCKVLFHTSLADDGDFKEMVRGLLRQGFDAGVILKPFEKSDLLEYVHKKIGLPPENDQDDPEEGQAGTAAVAQRERNGPSVPKEGIGPYDGLLEIATLNLYQTNAFRITGLDVDSSLRDVSKEAEKLEMMIKLGRIQGSGGIFSLSGVPTVESVKKALQSLKDPESRLVQEFFWFWPCTGSSKDDPALHALRAKNYKTAVEYWTNTKGPGNGVAIHNLAVFYHLGALDAAVRRSKTLEGTPTEEIFLWSSAYRYWRALLDRSDFWDAVIGRIRTINDPRLTVETSKRIWLTLPNAVVGINAQQAVMAAERGDVEEAARHRKLMHTSAFGETPAIQETRRALSHAQGELERLCENTEKNGRANPQSANIIARKLLDDKGRLLRAFNCLLGVGDPMCDAAHDRVAEAARVCIVAYVNAADDWVSARAVSEECLALAEGKALRLRLEEDLEIIRRNLIGKKQSQAEEEIERYCDNATREAKANPSRANLAARKLLDEKATLSNAFSTLLSIGQAAYDTGHDSLVVAARSCMIDYVNATEDWASGRSFTEECLALAKGEALRSKLIEDLEVIRRNLLGQQSQVPRQSKSASASAATQRARTSSPVRPVKWWNKDKLVPISIVGLVILFAAIKGCDDSTSPVHSVPSPSAAQPTIPESQSQSAPSYTNYSSQPSSNPFSGSTTNRSQLKAEIESESKTLDSLESELKIDRAQVDEYNSMLNVDKSALERMKRDNDAGIEVDENLYETTRHRYNANVNNYNQALADYKTKMAQYNQLLAATNGKIDRYNSLGGTR